MSRKSKGIGLERELIHLFWKTNEWAAIRVAGSGSSQYPSPDVLAGNVHRRLAIECKSSKDPSVYIPVEEIEQLVSFGSRFGCECWVGVRFDKQPWFFMNLEDIRKSDKNYAILLQDAQQKGVLFEELISA